MVVHMKCASPFTSLDGGKWHLGFPKPRCSSSPGSPPSSLEPKTGAFFFPTGLTHSPSPKANSKRLIEIQA